VNVWRQLKALERKLAIEVIGMDKGSKRYRVFTMKAILQRRKEKGYTHVLRDRTAVEIVRIKNGIQAEDAQAEYAQAADGAQAENGEGFQTENGNHMQPENASRKTPVENPLRENGRTDSEMYSDVAEPASARPPDPSSESVDEELNAAEVEAYLVTTWQSVIGT